MMDAYLDLLSMRKKQAIVKYTHIMNTSPYEKKIKWILARLRKIPIETITRRYGSQAFLFPAKDLFEKRPWTQKIFEKRGRWIVLMSILLFGGTGFGIYGLYRWKLLQQWSDHWRSKTKSSPHHDAIGADFFLKEFSRKEKNLLKQSLHPSNETSLYPDLSVQQVVQSYEAMRFFIHQRKINAALILYNQLMRSEVSFVYKRKIQTPKTNSTLSKLQYLPKIH